MATVGTLSGSDNETALREISQHTNLQVQELLEAESLFRKVDVSGDGALSIAEVDFIFRKMKTFLNLRQLWAIMAEVDEDGSGQVELQEFCMMLAKLRGRKSLSQAYHLRQLSRLKMQKFTEVFHVMDENKNGVLEREEAAVAFERIGIKTRNPDDFNQFFDRVDENKSGTIDLDEFLALMSQLQKQDPHEVLDIALMSLTEVEKEKFGKMFKQIDSSGDGGLGVDEVYSLFMALGYSSLSKQQVAALVKDVDVNNSGEVDYDEFLYLLVKLGLGSNQEYRSLLPPGAGYEEARKMNMGLNELWDLGYDHVLSLKQVGFSAKTLYDSGRYSLRDLRKAGFTPKEMRQACWNPKLLKLAGMSLAELRNAGFSQQALRLSCKAISQQMLDIPEDQEAAMDDPRDAYYQSYGYPLPLRNVEQPEADGQNAGSPRRPATSHGEKILPRWWRTPRMEKLLATPRPITAP